MGLRDAVVDIAIPVFRRTTFLADAVESVLGQTYDRWQLTIIDNGPGGGDIERAVQPYLADSRVSYKATGEELPLPENWTKAIRRGSAPFVALLHDDDRWHADYLGARVHALESHPECGFAFGESVQIERDGREVLRVPTRFPEGPLPRHALAHWLVRECIITSPTIVVRRAAYDAVGAEFRDVWQYCDWEMWARIAARFPAYYLARSDSDLRRHATTFSVLVQEKPKQLIAMTGAIEAIFEQELDGFEVTPIRRASNRSRILLRAAESIHIGGGWAASRNLYLHSLKAYPPAFFSYTSLRMVARTLLGARLSARFAAVPKLFRRLRAVRRYV